MTTAPVETVKAARWRVAELFGPTVQGEGLLIGTPAVFVRFGGCDYRCSWCDSMHAVLPQYRSRWPWMTVDQIADAVTIKTKDRPVLVVFSGGNPALYDLSPLLQRLLAAGHRVSCETQGSMWPAWLDSLSLLTVSPKPPSSGETPDLDTIAWALRAYQERRPGRLEVKVPLFDLSDLGWFATLRERLLDAPTPIPLTVSVGNPVTDPEQTETQLGREGHLSMLMTRWRMLADEILARGWLDVRVLPQLHVLAWGNAKGV